MAALRAYFDDSNDPRDKRHAILVMGGYVANLDQWKEFETLWQAALDEAQVPYFHLKEFGDKNGIYRDLKANPEREREFVRSMVKAITSTVQFCPVTAIRLDELREFNKHHNLNLDAHSLAVYGCVIELRRKYSDEDIEVVFDRFDKSTSRIEIGMGYARSDIAGDLKVNGFTRIPLQKDESFKRVLPLQAADLISGEIRKFQEERKTWQPPTAIGRTPRQIQLSYLQWWGEQYVQHGKPTRERKSYVALMEPEETAPSGYLWDKLIFDEVLSRHPNGWGNQS